mgnify:CR=1 FL=1
MASVYALNEVKVDCDRGQHDEGHYLIDAVGGDPDVPLGAAQGNYVLGEDEGRRDAGSDEVGRPQSPKIPGGGEEDDRGHVSARGD